MSGNIERRQAIQAVNNYSLCKSLDYASESVGALYGENVFSLSVMKRCIPKSVYQNLVSTIEGGERLDPSVADVVANAMKDWAIEKGATHFAHVFFPLTGLTAEKHDSFYSPDGEGRTIAEFSGKLLVQGEPDASSFPSGGIRVTFEARGYTAWDVTSPAYILNNINGATLCIPTVFVSWTGEALDKKTPVLRSNQAVEAQAKRILSLFGNEVPGRIKTTAGAEQEYFLIDRHFFFARPDLINAGRTLFGAPAPKGQEMDDHYFGAIPERVQALMFDFERELFKLGIPVKTRHNEVAPGQFETAPVFEDANVATDHQQMTMIILRRVAHQYGLKCLMHEKPFAGLNGSGKHLNFSIGGPKVGNLLEPGDTPQENAQFLVFCAAFIRGVSLHAELLRASVASAGNDHRLGANEAPPAILSIFLGDQLTDVFERIKTGGVKESKAGGTLTIGVDSLPPLPRDAGDRNRTSPFAFTGNRFEFRAVGANQSIAGPIAVLNTILAESLDYAATQLENAIQGDPRKLNGAVEILLKEIITEHEKIIFNGDNYSEHWHKEAEKRGLPNLRSTYEALPAINSEKAVALFEKYKVLNKREVDSRAEAYLEQYDMAITVEANLMFEMARTIIFPAAIRYQGELATTCANLKALGYEFDTDTLDLVTALVKKLQDSTVELEALNAHKSQSALAQAKHIRFKVIPKMEEIRGYADKLEGLVADDLWPLPTYQEMLFIK